MEVFFLGGLFPPKYLRSIEKNSKGVIQYAANLLQWNLIKGLDYYFKTDIITLPFIGAFPLLYKKIHIPEFRFNHYPESSDISLSFYNLLLFKNISRYYSAKKELIERIKNDKDRYLIFIYSIHSPFLLAAIHTKLKYPNVRTCLLVPDLPEYMSSSQNVFYLLFKKIDSFLINYAIKNIDSFVVLTDEMITALKIQNKPWVRVEGIFEKSEVNNITKKEQNKVIMYSGTLACRYGIMNLIEAFNKIKSPDYRLWICGEGDMRKEIEKIAAKNVKIQDFGQLPQEEVHLLQKMATVLVNPRTSEGEFTKYSFPSKTIEYLASGTPTILHRLPGIPKEYFNYAFVCEDENIEGLMKKIIEVCEKPQTELEVFGARAREFIIKEKNAINQVRKISKMVNSL